MKFARLFLATIAICMVLSSVSAYMMVKFLANTIGSTFTETNAQKPVSSQPVSIVQSNSNLSNLESGVKSIASQVSPSVVSIVITREVQTYRTDPY